MSDPVRFDEFASAKWRGNLEHVVESVKKWVEDDSIDFLIVIARPKDADYDDAQIGISTGGVRTSLHERIGLMYRALHQFLEPERRHDGSRKPA